MIVTNSIPVCSDENLFGVSFMSYLKFLSSFVLVIIGAEVYVVLEVRVTTSFPINPDEYLFVSYFDTLVSSGSPSAYNFENRWTIYSCLVNCDACVDFSGVFRSERFNRSVCG